MKQENITKVTISEDDLKVILRQYLNSKGLDPLEEITIDVGSELQGHGSFETEVSFIRPINVDCRRID